MACDAFSLLVRFVPFTTGTTKEMCMYCNKKQFVAALALVPLLLVGAWTTSSSAQQRPPGDPPQGVDQEGVETLTRGPVHEAFGAPSANDPQPTEIVNARPPEPIEEEAPDFKPEGAIWIPGYWDWDVASSRHIWVSGMWRVPPPGMRWVPPYWTEASGGWQRVPGFWVSAQATALDYHATPPESLEVGPSTPAPGDNYFYVPGCWNYYDSGFRWRAGYWAPYRDNYVWCPDRWYWTLRGCIFTAGFWDWQPAVRGQLFAPIVFTSNVYLQPGWRYRPWCVIDTARFFAHLWIGPRAHCYYFGNYYGPWSSRWGFTPWCNWRYGSRFYYDPIWSWSNVYYGRHGIDFIDRTSGWHRYYERNEVERPAITFDQQCERLAEGRIDRNRDQSILAADLRDIAQRDDSPLTLSRVDQRQRESVRRMADEIRQVNVERRRTEVESSVARGEARTDRTDRGAPERPGRPETARLKLPEVSQEVRRAAAGATVPERPDRSRSDVDTPRTARRPESRERPERPETQPRTTESPEREPGPQPQSPEAAPRTEAPRVETPRTERPQTETPRTKAPRTEAPRVEAPRVEAPRPAPRMETPRAESPRTEAPRAAPPRSAPRTESPRVSSNPRPRSEGSRSGGRSRDRDR
jgi:hypothetical protein